MGCFFPFTGKLRCQTVASRWPPLTYIPPSTFQECWSTPSKRIMSMNPSNLLFERHSFSWCRTCGVTGKPWWLHAHHSSLGMTGRTHIGMRLQPCHLVGFPIWHSGNAASSRTLRVLFRVVHSYLGTIRGFTRSDSEHFSGLDNFRGWLPEPITVTWRVLCTGSVMQWDSNKHRWHQQRQLFFEGFEASK